MTFYGVLDSHPQPTGLDRNALLRCIDECLDCAASCSSFADADLAEDDLRGDGALHSPLPRLRRRLQRHRAAS
jgi:hypothetical protein